NASCSLACITNVAHEETTEGYGNDGLWKARKTKTQVSLASHSPWKSVSRFPHSHSPDEARESGKRQARFPLFRCCFVSTKEIRKETPQRIAPLPLPGSFFNEKMLRAQH